MVANPSKTDILPSESWHNMFSLVEEATWLGGQSTRHDIPSSLVPALLKYGCTISLLLCTALQWVRFFGFVGRKPVVVYNRRDTRLISITWRLIRQAQYRRTPISPNFNQGVEAARPVSPLSKYCCAIFARLQRLTTHPRSCDRRKPEAQARQWHTPFWCQRNTANDYTVV